MFRKKGGRTDNPADGAHFSSSQDPDLTEASSKIWLPYLKYADRFDRDLVEGWRDDMESLLIFAALFSSSVTAFVIESNTSLQEGTGEIAVNVLLQISQQLANTTLAPATRPSPFTPSPGDVAVNVLWFLSLSFSLACALAAVMVRQWARRYLRLPRSLSSTPDQARMRQYLFEKLEWWKMDLVVETIPILLHISLILFIIGLLLFVNLVNFQVALFLLYFTGIAGGIYSLLTIMPILSPGCPYKTPFSTLLPLGLRLSSTIIKVTLASMALSVKSIASVIAVASPSLKIPRFRWAHTTMDPIWHALRRRCRQFHENLRTMSQQFFLYPRLQESMITAGVPRSATLGKDLLYSQGCEQLTDRDSRALHLVLEFSHDNNDVFTIVKSVPSFIQACTESKGPVTNRLLQDLHLAQSVVLHSGVTRYLQLLFESCFVHGVIRPSMHAILSTGMNTLHWLIRSPDWRVQYLPAPYRFYLARQSESDLAGIVLDSSSPLRNLRWLANDNITKQLWVITVASFVLNRLYHLEHRLHAQKGYLSPPATREHFREMLGVLREGADLMSYHSQDVGGLRDLGHLPSDISIFLHGIRDARFKWASWLLLNLDLRILQETPAERLIFYNGLCDAVTHLYDFPQTPPKTQAAFYQLVDTIFRSQGETTSGPANSFNISLTLLDMVCRAYDNVLFGMFPVTAFYPRRYYFHGRHYKITRVCGTEEVIFDPASSDLQISFSDYREILEKHLTHCKGLTMLGEEIQLIDIHDAQSQLIHDILLRRADHDFDISPHIKVDIDESHVSVVQELMTHHWAHPEFVHLLRRTADDFGYTTMLDPSQVPMELLYYNVDSPPPSFERLAWP